jgi:hypothetical protein
MVQVVKCLFNKHQALSSNFNTAPPAKKKTEVQEMISEIMKGLLFLTCIMVLNVLALHTFQLLK